MICSNCGIEMEAGILRTDGSPCLFYIPNTENIIYGRIITKKEIELKGGVVLDGPYVTRFHVLRVKCNICKKCRKIVIDY